MLKKESLDPKLWWISLVGRIDMKTCADTDDYKDA